MLLWNCVWKRSQRKKRNKQKKSLKITTSEIQFQVGEEEKERGKKNISPQTEREKRNENDKRNNAQVQNLTLKIDFGIFILAERARNYQKDKTENTWNNIMSCTDYFSSARCCCWIPWSHCNFFDFCGNCGEERKKARWWIYRVWTSIKNKNKPKGEINES